MLRGSKTDPQRPRPRDPLTTDSVRRRPTKLSHLIEDVTCEEGLSLLPRATARSKALPNDRLVPEEGVLYTGLSIVGEGEWAAAKHGGRSKRGWKKLHLGVDGSGVIVAHTLTEATADDATTGIGLIAALDADIARVTADAAYDTNAFYDTATARGATVVVPPHKTARVSRRGPRSSARDRTIKKMMTIGRRRWKKASGYYRQARVENAFFRYKSIIGGSLRARSPGGRATEAVLACNILNQMTELGRSESYRLGR